jgi:hypothetical protein
VNLTQTHDVQIGQALVLTEKTTSILTEKTASVHVCHILVRVRVAGRGEVAAIARRLDLDQR